MDFAEKPTLEHPLEKANPISRLLFIWILPLFKKGYNEGLQTSDLYQSLQEDSSQLLGDRLSRAWERQVDKARRNNKRPKFMYALINVFWKRYLLSVIFYILDSWVIVVAQPLFLRLLVNSYGDENGSDEDRYWYAIGICVATFLHALVLHPAVFAVFHIGMQCRVAASALVYRKSLKLSKTAQGETTVGQIVNILSNDLNKFDTNVNFIPFIFIGPGQVAIFMYFMWEDLGASTLTGLALTVLLFPLQYYSGKYSAIFRHNIAVKTDERGRMMNEIIIGMRVIKMYAWEKPFSVIIDKIRRLEVKELKKRGHLRGAHSAFINFAPKVVAYFTFLTFVLSGNEMTAGTVFFAVAVFNIVIQMMIHFVPTATAGAGELIVAMNRIEDFLLLEDIDSKAVSNKDDICQSKFTDITNANEPSVCLQNVTSSWTGKKPTLENISINLSGDKLIAVVGSVGSGKTSLLHTLIKELPIQSGSLSVEGKISYASQESWIFAGNLRQNILFGLPYDKQRYYDVINACALEQDLKQFPHGDLTVVGERGVALSGGQKARVNMARALYREADIYLLDDPLSAVDARVSRHLFEKCCKSHLKGKLRILATHQLQYLPQADHIIVLHQGKIVAQGNYAQIMELSTDFFSMITTENEEFARKQSVVKVETVRKMSKKPEEPKKEEEKMQTGSVTWKTYKEYFKSGQAPFGLKLLILSFFLAQLGMSGHDYALSFWTNAEDDKNDCLESSESNCEDGYLGEYVYLGIYTAFAVGTVVFCLCRSIYFFIYCTKISINLHNWMFTSMIRAPTKFYDDNPSGRIMNRFTKDCGVLDEMLSIAMIETVVIFLKMFGVIVIVNIVNYYLILPTIVLFVGLYALRQFFVASARDLKRIEAITRSPLFTHVAATMQGITTIRALNCQDLLIQQFDGHQDLHSASWFLFIAANRWFGIWLELISCIFLAVASFFFLVLATSSGSGELGLAISSILTLLGSFQWGMRQSAETENYMTSVERALEYARLEPEAPLESTSEKQPPKDWPTGGKIEFKDVSLAYGTKLVLKNLSFTIASREKIGIVGRTGAGKSSIIAALFRMTEPTGSIFIDTIKINDIGLHDLRKGISIIPQDPVLFSGSVRYNLDPFEQFSDHELWQVIEEVELKTEVSSLDAKVSDGGSNFSVGQRQLVCLARAILRKNKIIVMDEATANVDPRTDNLIQRTIREKFADCTIITIAHRLHTVMDSDRILVLDNGYLKEYDHPYVLLENPERILSRMVSHTGSGTSDLLHKIAADAYFAKKK